MMRYEEGTLTDNKPCSGIRADLKMCLLESDCCKIVNIFLKKKLILLTVNEYFLYF